MRQLFISIVSAVFLFFSTVDAHESVEQKARQIAQSSKIFILNFAIDELYKKLEIDMQLSYIKGIVVYDYMMDDYIISSYKNSQGTIVHGQNLPTQIKSLEVVNIDIYQDKTYDKTVVASLSLYYDSSFLPSHQKLSIQLSEIEKEYLKSKKVIQTCIDPDWLPFEAIDTNGKHIGMSADVLKLIKESSGIDFELVKTKNWTQSIEFMKKRKCDILPLAMKSDKRSEYFNFTEPYINFSFVVVTNYEKIFIDGIEALFNKKISLVKDYAYIEILQKEYPQIEIIEVNNLIEGIKLIRKGEVYGHVDALALVAYTLQKEGITDVKIAGKLPQERFLGIATHNSDSILHLIMQKMIKNIPPEKIREIQNKWLAIKFEEKIDYSLVYKILIVFGILLCIGLWRYYEIKKVNAIILEKNQALNKASKQYAFLAITDRLTSLYNRYKIDEILLSNKELSDRYKNSFGVILIDIDYFKNINDTYGHQVGDKTLRSFALILLASIRKSDSVGRWGGEEFLIIVPNATKESIIAFAENIRIEIEKSKFEKIGHLSISLGASIYEQSESIESLIARADKALYISKNKGRNCVHYL